ncbi:CAP domain-containing protein [Candidatus Uhrbacteria bacterium]|nr:CAP domain-containing protein [Candidatus Uhrbacteria bacterium]
MPYLSTTLGGLLSLGLLSPPVQITYTAESPSLTQRLAGRILLQVESRGEAYYVDPLDNKRYYLGRPADAFWIMRNKGLGIKHDELSTYLSAQFPGRLSGRILLDVESRGEAYYVDPVTRRGSFLGNPTRAFLLMSEKGLGISTADLEKIPAATLSVNASGELEQSVFQKINDVRANAGLGRLVWNDQLAASAKIHSQNMANGTASVGHDGFNERVADIRTFLDAGMIAENVAANNARDPVHVAVNGWMESTDHKENIERRVFDTTGIGIAIGSNGIYYFTQIFSDAQ